MIKKILTACCVCSVLFQSVSGTAAVIYGKPVQGYSRPSVVRPQHNYTNPQTLAANVESQEYNQIIDYLYADDYTGLRSAKENGLNINAHNRQGDTAVCTAVKAKRYRWFSMLKASGADVGEKCMEKIDIKAREEFIDGYTMRGGSLVYAEKEAMLTGSSVNWLVVGGITGGVALAGGATALALSGGGGGGGSSSETTPSEDEDIAPKDWPWHKSTDAAPSGKPVFYGKNPTTTDKTNPKYYKTAEFGGSNFSNAQNFLEQSGAQYAYAYAAAADAAVAGEGIIIGQVDTGIDYSHSELSGQIATDSNGNKLGINFHYGPCRKGDTTNCWLVDTNSMIAKFYDNNGTITQWETLTSSELEAWTEYEPTFPSDYDWDANKYNMVIYGDKDTHGTHVAGIMAASKDSIGMHGLAYNSKIIGAAVDLDWLGSTREIYTSFRYLVDNDVSIINNSWGLSDEMSSNPTIARANFNNYTTVKQAINYARQNSVISVFAAGNSAFNYTGYESQGYNYNPMNANTLSGAPMAIPSLLYHWNEKGELEAYSSYPSDVSQIASSLFVTVVSVNENNEIAYYSQKCGPAAKWCIAAPGGEKRESNSSIASIVGSSVSDTGYANYQGTSMATPVVSSALAVIMAAFPSLTAQEAVAVLFETAIDLGNEDMYGHGLLNLKGAMEPVGTLTLATGNTTSEKVVLNNTRITVPHSFEVSTDIPVEIMVLDKYKRGYNISTSALVRSTGHSKQIFANDLRLFTKSGKKQNVRFSDTLSFSFSDTKSAFDTNALAGKSFALTWNDEDKLEMTFSFSSDNKLQNRSFEQKDLNNPFTSSMTDVYALSNQFKLSDSLKFSVSGFVGKNNFFDGNERLQEKNDDSMKSVVSGIAYQPFERFSVNLTAGLLNEKSSMLGMSGYGAFETKGSNTRFAGIEMNWSPVDKWHIDFGYYQGYTNGQKQNSFISISDIKSESFGFNTGYDLTEELQVGVNIASPLRVRKGYMDFDLPVARDATQDIVYRQSVRADLSPKARQMNYGLYVFKQTDNLSWRAMGQVRVHPEHNSTAKPDYRMMMAVSLNY